MGDWQLLPWSDPPQWFIDPVKGTVMEVTMKAAGDTLCQFDMRLDPGRATQRQLVGIEVFDVDDDVDDDFDGTTWADTLMDLETWIHGGSENLNYLHVLRATGARRSEIEITRKLVWPKDGQQLAFGCRIKH